MKTTQEWSFVQILEATWNNCSTATCRPSHKSNKQDEPDMRSTVEIIRDLLLWTIVYGRSHVSRPTKIYIDQLCEDTGCQLNDPPGVMDDREGWRESHGTPCYQACIDDEDDDDTGLQKYIFSVRQEWG